MAKIAILGAGSIGCWIGGHLAAGGADVTLIGRERYKSEISANGLHLTHFDRADVQIDTIDFVTTPEILSGADIIALCVKSQDTHIAAQQILAYAPNALVVSFQNGIRNPEILSKVLPPENIIPAIVPFNVTSTAPGRFHCGTAGPLVLAEDNRLREFVSVLEAADQDVELSSNIVGDQWAKMLANLNNGLNSLSGKPLLAGLNDRDYRRALVSCLKEALQVAERNQVKLGKFNGRSPSMLLKTLRLPNWAYRIVLQKIVKIDAKARSSMLDDLELGRPTEIEYLQGEIVRQAEKVNMKAPDNAAIQAAVLKAFKAGKSPELAGAEILALLK